MKFLFDPQTDGSWVAVQDGIDKDELSYRLKNADLVISDLDDTDAPSPAKAMAFGRPFWEYLVDRKLRNWYFRAAKSWATEGKEAESKVWKEYVELFLRDPKELEIVKRRFTPISAKETFYPGVMDFYYQVLNRESNGAYISRNIREVVAAYQAAATFNFGLHEVSDKGAAVAELLDHHAHMYPNRRIIVKGDSPEDEAMVDVLESRRRAGQIESVTSIFVSKRPEMLNPNFDVNIGRNYSGLVTLLKQTEVKARL